METPDALRAVSEGRKRRWRFYWPDWPVTLLIGVMIAVFLAMFADLFIFGGADWRQTGGASALAVREGRWETLITSIFLHGGIMHIWLNMAALASLGAPVSLRFGKNLKGALWFYALFMVCGLVGGLTFVAMNWNGATPMIGASGAIFGLWAASARIGGGGSPTLLSPFHPFVRSQIVAAVVSNLIIIAVFWFLGAISGGGAIGLAWEAHLGGFVAGFFLIGPFLRLSSRHPTRRSPWNMS
jgi:membrane associated rhomboid family serine protease